MLTLEDSIYRLVGERIKKRRSELSMTQGELATGVGMLRTSIANVEAGRQRPPLHVLYQISQAIGLELKDLVPTTEEITTNDSYAVQEGQPKLPKKAAQLLREMIEHDEPIVEETA